MAAPMRWPMYRHGCRRYVFPNQYPYSLIYRITGLDDLEIVAIPHDKLKPGHWKHR